MERDSTAANNGYTTSSYIQALEEGLMPYYKPLDIFVQDNARIHTSYRAKEWLMDHGIWVAEWPPYSPDLNPIEHLWWALKKIMYKDYPQFNNFSTAQEHWEEFCEALKASWLKIPSLLIKKLILSMPRRLDACRRARGRQTKY
jgi:transposase